MFFIYVILGCIIAVVGVVLIKSAELLLNFGTVMSLCGVAFLIIYVLVHFCVTYKSGKKEGESMGDILCDTVSFACLNFPALAFFILYMPSIVIGMEEKDGFGLVTFLFWTIIALGVHLALWGGMIAAFGDALLDENRKDRFWYPFVWLFIIGCTIALDEVLTLGELLATTPLQNMFF